MIVVDKQNNNKYNDSSNNSNISNDNAVKNKTSNEQQWSQYKSRNNTKIWKLTEMEVTTARKQVKIAMFL